MLTNTCATVASVGMPPGVRCVGAGGGVNQNLGNRYLRSSMQIKTDLRAEHPVAAEAVFAVFLNE